jgi:hypothetical protein
VNYSNTRRSNRIYVRMRVEIAIESDGTISSFQASTTDLSPLGARIQTNTALACGARVNIIWSGPKSRSLPSEVIWSAQTLDGPEHEAGLKFLQPLPSDP